MSCVCKPNPKADEKNNQLVFNTETPALIPCKCGVAESPLLVSYDLHSQNEEEAYGEIASIYSVDLNREVKVEELAPIEVDSLNEMINNIAYENAHELYLEKLIGAAEFARELAEDR